MSRSRVTLDHLIEARNRYLSAAACLTAASDVTATPSPASLLFRRTYYSKVEGVRVPTNGLSPTILAPDTDYVFVLANTTNKTVVLTLILPSFVVTTYSGHITNKDRYMSNLTNITADGDFLLTGANTTRQASGVIYLGGSDATGKMVFGYAEPGVFPETFKAFVDGAFSSEKRVKHGIGITLMVRVTGWTGGDVTDILYAPD